jgi:hypothetical protein
MTIPLHSNLEMNEYIIVIVTCIVGVATILRDIILLVFGRIGLELKTGLIELILFSITCTLDLALIIIPLIVISESQKCDVTFSFIYWVALAFLVALIVMMKGKKNIFRLSLINSTPKRKRNFRKNLMNQL